MEPGLATTLNQGLLACKAKLVARIDQDDMMSPDRLETQVLEMNTRPSVVCLGSQIRFIDSNNNLIGKSNYPNSPSHVRFSLPATNCIAHPSVILDKSAVQSVGGYNETLDGVEDYNLWLRLLSVGEVGNSKDCLTLYRLHPKQMSRENRSVNQTLEAIARLDSLGEINKEPSMSWSKTLKGMNEQERVTHLLQLESGLSLHTRRKLKSYRNLAEFFSSAGVKKLKCLFLALFNAPVRSFVLLALFFFLFRIEPMSNKRDKNGN